MPASVVWTGLGCVLVIYLFSFGWNPGARVALGPFWNWTGSPVAGVERQEREPRRYARAELDAPPEIPPTAKAPAATVKPIASPKNPLPGWSLLVATLSIT